MISGLQEPLEAIRIGAPKRADSATILGMHEDRETDPQRRKQDAASDDASGKQGRDPYRIDVGERLRVTAAEFGFISAQAFADYIGQQRGTVDAWFNGRALPPVQVILPFCERHGLTLDWVYKGDPSSLPLSLNIRLVAAMQGEAVPPARNHATKEDEPPLPSEAWHNLGPTHEPRRKPVRRKPKENASGRS